MNKVKSAKIKRDKTKCNSLKPILSKLIAGIIVILFIGFLMYALLFAVMYFI